ncbi:hypothetical protein KIF59_08705 [Enterobacter cloacae subsp. cloacae]|nr:hypothetical protein [Enterobacter cloacae subsp. cloacae]
MQSAGTVEDCGSDFFIRACWRSSPLWRWAVFYNLNEKMYVRIVEEIELRKRTA